ncbi:MAG TPA: hypothetical protein VFA07_05645 [Chthonomonadaceae bacterium]|nr:hypothetical protein [Chthonomonadaceae bacterium]
MDCQHLHRSTGLTSLWRRLRCPQCWAAQAVDRVIARGIARMQVEPAPAGGQARVLAELTALFPPRPRSRSIWRRRLLPPGVLTAGLAAAGYGWVYWSDIDPNVSIPTHAMPSVNAFDTYRAAARVASYKDQVLSAEIYSPPLILRPPYDHPSGPTHFGGVPAGRSAAAKPRDPLAHLPPYHVYTLQEKELLLQRNARALALLRQGLREPYLRPAIHSVNADFNYRNNDQSLIDLLELEQQVREERGDWLGAVNSGLDALQFGEQIARGAGVGRYTNGWYGEPITIDEGSGIYAVVPVSIRKRLWGEIRHLDAAQTRVVIQRLKQIVSLHVPPAEAYQESKWTYQAEVENVFQYPKWRPRSLDQNDPLDHSPMQTLMKWLHMLPYTKRQIMHGVTAYFDHLIASARRPYRIRPDKLSAPNDPVNTRLKIETFGEGLENNRREEAADRALNGLLLVYAALQVYRNDHGVYPSALSQLVPRYLQAVPDDPFALQGPFRYRRKGAQYVLYSIGPDGIDQQGTLWRIAPPR